MVSNLTIFLSLLYLSSNFLCKCNKFLPWHLIPAACLLMLSFSLFKYILMLSSSYCYVYVSCYISYLFFIPSNVHIGDIKYPPRLCFPTFLVNDIFTSIYSFNQSFNRCGNNK